MWLAGGGRGQDIVSSPGLDPAVGHPHRCWILSLLHGLEVFVRGRLGWQESNLFGLHYIQPLISQILPSQMLVTKWVWTKILLTVSWTGSMDAGVRPGPSKAASPLPGSRQTMRCRGIFVPALSELSFCRLTAHRGRTIHLNPARTPQNLLA